MGVPTWEQMIENRIASLEERVSESNFSEGLACMEELIDSLGTVTDILDDYVMPPRDERLELLKDKIADIYLKLSDLKAS